MTFEYFKNFFNTTTTTTTSLKTKTTCPTKLNICSNNDSEAAGGSSSEKDSCYTRINSKKVNFDATTTTTCGRRTGLYPTTLRRKIRKTSRRKKKRRHYGCLHNNVVNMADNRKTPIITTTSTTTPSTTITSHKCKISVNNTITTNFNSYINNYNGRKYFCKPTCCAESGKNVCSCCCIRKTTNSRTSHCSCCPCSCSRKKKSSIAKNIVSLLSSQAKLAQAETLTTITANNRKYFVNNFKQKKVQLHSKQQKWKRLKKHLHALGECATKATVQQQANPFITTTSCINSTLSARATTTAVEAGEKQTTESSLPAYLPATNCSNNIFSTQLPQCLASANNTNLTNSYSFATPPSSLSSFTTWYSLSCPAPARIFNELLGVIFMTLLVLSICHNNVLETSAASVEILKRDVVASSVAVEQTIMPNYAAAAVKLNKRLHRRQQPPEQLPSQHNHQQLQQANYKHLQPQFYSNEEVEQQQPLENEMQEDKSNHNFQPQIEPETLPTYEQRERDQQQLQQQHLTTQASSFHHDVALETTYNHTFQSLSIIDGDLTVAVDTSQNLMTVEEEMLVAAAGGAIGVGSNSIGLGNHLEHYHLHSGLESHDSTDMGLDGINVMTHNAERNAMPIFDFGMPRNITARTGHTEAVIKCRVDRLDDKSVSWIRKRDLHILTVGTATYTSDKRFQVTESKDSREWTLHVKSPQARDSGIYECQVNTEPKISMAFQLNIIEISPDAKAVITGPADLHFKVGSAIILTCIIHQPSVKDIGPIYWYRGEYMITPFDINENTHEDLVFPLAGVTPPQMAQNEVNGLERNYVQDSLFRGSIIGAAAAAETEQMPQILTNEITQDFAQRIAMESQLGDTMKSRLRISNAQTSDTGNYTCQPTTASSASVMVHVINDENPAAMQKSGANSFYCKSNAALMPFVCAIIIVCIAAATASISDVICVKEQAKYVDDVDDCCCYWLPSAVITKTKTTTTRVRTTATKRVLKRNVCCMLTCLHIKAICKSVLAGTIDLKRQQQQLLLQYNLPPQKIPLHNAADNNIQLMQSDDYALICWANAFDFVLVVFAFACICSTNSASDSSTPMKDIFITTSLTIAHNDAGFCNSSCCTVQRIQVVGGFMVRNNLEVEVNMPT